MLPGRLGLRFALEALFLVLLAIGAGLADLRPALIVLVMGVAWVLVALIEFTAERIAASPVSYLLPQQSPPEEGEPERVFWPRPEERTVVAPPEAPPAPEEATDAAPAPEPQLEAQAEVETEPEAPLTAPEEPEEPEPDAVEPPRRRRLRSLLRRRGRGLESEPASPPRHVKLLPRRAAPEPSRAAQEVADLFGSGQDEERKRKERGA
jgi:hypothetical protein